MFSSGMSNYLLGLEYKCLSENDNYSSCAFSMFFFYETVMEFKWIGLKYVFDCHQTMCCALQTLSYCKSACKPNINRYIFWNYRSGIRFYLFLSSYFLNCKQCNYYFFFIYNVIIDLLLNVYRPYCFCDCRVKLLLFSYLDM